MNEGEPPPFGTVGRLDYDEIEDRLLCHFCGAWKQSLAHHVWRAHQLTADEYRALTGLNRQTRLITPTLSAKLRTVTAPLIARLKAEGKLRNWRENPEKFTRDKAAAVEAIREGLRPEASTHRSAAFSTPEQHDARADRRRQRNLAGLDRATPEAIREGLKRAGPGACRDCGATFERNSPTHYYCPACAIERQRAVWRAYAKRRRMARKENP